MIYEIINRLNEKGGCIARILLEEIFMLG